MKILSSLIIFFITLFSFSQNEISKELGLIEKEIKQNGGTTDFEKIEVDLDNDNDLDYIYSYNCSEVKCLSVYINKNHKLEKVITENCYNYYLYNGKLKGLILKLNHCCGESPFTSVREFNFNQDNYSLNSNYVISNSSNFGNGLFTPEILLENSYNVLIINENYNVRFSPDIREFDEDESMFACEPNTNIIGKLKKGSQIKVLSELIKENRLWLFVEINNNQLIDELCKSPIDFDFENQKLRAWISGNFVELINN